MATSSKVFFSYAGDTKPLAQELTRALESQGMEVWVDFKDLQPGERWKDQLERAIEAAHWLLILVGPGSRASAWQEAEWSAALAHTWTNGDKKLLPVMVGSTEPPPFLRSWVPLKIDPAAEPTTWTRQVIEVLQATRKEPVPGKKVNGRRERDQRLDEIGKAAEGLREGHSEELPIAPNGQP